MERTPTSQTVCGTKLQRCQGFMSEKADIPAFRATRASGRGSLKSKKGGQLSIHYNGDSSTAEFLCRTTIPVSQLSVYGAISDWCEELAQQTSDHSFPSTERPVAEMNDGSESRISPNVVSILTNAPRLNVPVQGNLLRSHSERFETRPENIRAIEASETIGFMRKNFPGQCFVTIHDADLTGFEHAGACREYTLPRSDKRFCSGWIDSRTHEDCPITGNQGHVTLWN